MKMVHEQNCLVAASVSAWTRREVRGSISSHELTLVAAMQRFARFALLVVITLLTGCENKSDLRTTKMPIGNTTFTLEVADTDASREHGLMQRDGMPDDHGMISSSPTKPRVRSG